MALKQVTVVEATAEVELRPAHRRRLQMNLKAYADLKAQADELKEEMQALVADIEKVREQTGAKSIGLEGYGRVTLVEGTNTRYDDKKLLGYLSPAQLAECKTTKPKKAFTKVTLPGAKDDHEE